MPPWGLLGLMIEQVSDTEFCTYMAQSILGAIGMQRSSFKLTPEIENLLSKGYRKGKEFETGAFARYVCRVNVFQCNSI